MKGKISKGRRSENPPCSPFFKGGNLLKKSPIQILSLFQKGVPSLFVLRILSLFSKRESRASLFSEFSPFFKRESRVLEGRDFTLCYIHLKQKISVCIAGKKYLTCSVENLPNMPYWRKRYRREMVTHFNKKLYGQRWQSETVMLILKKSFGEEATSKSYWAQCREMALKVLTHNLSILMSA